MMIRWCPFFLLIVFAVLNCRAQDFVSVMDQSFVVHSAGNVFVNANSTTRNQVTVNFPARTMGYVYRVTAAKGNTGQGDKLIGLLKSMAPRQVVMEAALAQYALNYSDGGAVDVFAFNRVNDVNAFLRKQDGYWQPCWSNLGVISTCFATAQCLGPTVYFGFRNNNLAAPVNVQLEVVAIVDTSVRAAIASGYTIVNGANQGLTYLISTDRQNWERHSIIAGDTQTLNLSQSPVYIRVVTSLFNMVTYEIQPGRRYRIVWSNANKWDVIVDP